MVRFEQTSSASGYSSSSSSSSIANVPFGVDFGVSYDDEYRNDRSTSRSSGESTIGTGWVATDDDDPILTRQYHRSSSFSSSRCTKAVERSVIQLVYFVAFLSWIAALYSTGNSQKLANQLQRERMAHELELSEQRNAVKALREEVEGEVNYVENLEKTRSALKHEVRMLTEFADTADFSMSPAPEKRRGDDDSGNTDMVESWLSHRRHGLEQRLNQLQFYLQESSRRDVTERYVQSI